MPKYKGAQKIHDDVIKEIKKEILDQITNPDGRRIALLKTVRKNVAQTLEDRWLDMTSSVAHREWTMTLIANKVASDSSLRQAKRELLEEGFSTERVNLLYLEDELFWNDAEYLQDHRKKYYPAKGFPTVALTGADTDEWVTTENLERHNKSDSGSSKSMYMNVHDVLARGAMTDELARERAAAKFESDRVDVLMQDNKAYTEELTRLRIVNG